MSFQLAPLVAKHSPYRSLTQERRIEGVKLQHRLITFRDPEETWILLWQTIYK
jgi:hypothetical protein